MRGWRKPGGHRGFRDGTGGGGGGSFGNIAADTLLGNNTIAPAAPAALTVAQVQALLGLTPDDSFLAAAKARATALGLSYFTYLPSLGSSDGGVTSLLGLDGNVEGGGLKTSGTTATDLTGVTIFQTPKTSKWYLAGRCFQSTVNAANLSPLAIGAASGSPSAQITNGPAIGGAGHNWFVRFYDGTAQDVDTGVLALVGWGFFELWADGTGLVWTSVNGSAPVSATPTHMPTVPVTVKIAGADVTNYCLASRLFFASVAP